MNNQKSPTEFIHNIKYATECAVCDTCTKELRNQTLDEVEKIIEEQGTWFKTLVQPNVMLHKIKKEIKNLKEVGKK